MWAQGNNEFYNVDVIPPAPILYYTEGTILELTLLYNVQYNVSIVAFLCEFNRTDTITFLYGKLWNQLWYYYPTYINILYIVQCLDPQQLLTNDHLILNYDNHLTEGSNVTLSCVHDSSVMFELVGPRVIMCTENGEWEPDPRNVECIGTDIKIQASKSCTCMSY